MNNNQYQLLVFLSLVTVNMLVFSCRNNDKLSDYQIDIFVPKDMRDTLGKVFLVKNLDTIVVHQFTIESTLAQRRLYDAFPNETATSVQPGWSCIIKEKKWHLTGSNSFLAIEETLNTVFQKTRTTNQETALGYLVSQLFAQELYISSRSETWAKCENRYRQRVKIELDRPPSEGAFLGGGDYCQLKSLLAIDSLEETLLSNQYLLTPSGCQLYEQNVDTSQLFISKPYYLIEFDDNGKELTVNIDLVNKLYYFSWMEF